MDYLQMKNMARSLLSRFGNARKCMLLHRVNGEVREYAGVGVKLRYEAKAVDGNIIRMGDAKVICQFDVEPTEMTDIVQFGDSRYSVISSGNLSPDGVTEILYELQVRKQGE